MADNGCLHGAKGEDAKPYKHALVNRDAQAWMLHPLSA